MIYMDMKHYKITVTSEECGYLRSTEDAADLTAYLLSSMPQALGRLRPAVIVCPGGGYGFVSPRKDQPVAMEFLAAGYQVFVLHYHVAPEIFPLALMELARSVALIRDHSEEWCIDRSRIMVCGFSAGGHLAGCLGTMWNREFLYGPLGLTAEEIRPGGMILCYPVITSGGYGHQRSFSQLLGAGAVQDPDMRRLVSLEHQAGPHVPRTFLWHTWTDESVPVENSLLFVQALRKYRIPTEFHMYPVGGHGLSTCDMLSANAEGYGVQEECQSWLMLAKKWLEEV